MSRLMALPFVLKRSDDIIGEAGITSTAETIHGVLRLDGESLVFQWRLSRTVDRVGSEIRTDHEVEPVREVTIPLRGVAAATIKRSWWPWNRPIRCVLTAADLRAFEELSGVEGLRLDHPAEVVLRVRKTDLDIARQFVAELELAVAELALREVDEPTRRLR